MTAPALFVVGVLAGAAIATTALLAVVSRLIGNAISQAMPYIGRTEL